MPCSLLLRNELPQNLAVCNNEYLFSHTVYEHRELGAAQLDDSGTFSPNDKPAVEWAAVLEGPGSLLSVAVGRRLGLLTSWASPQGSPGCGFPKDGSQSLFTGNPKDTPPLLLCSSTPTGTGGIKLHPLRGRKSTHVGTYEGCAEGNSAIASMTRTITWLDAFGTALVPLKPSHIPSLLVLSPHLD